MLGDDKNEGYGFRTIHQHQLVSGTYDQGETRNAGKIEIGGYGH